MKTLFIMGIISLLFCCETTAQDGKLSKKEQKRIVELLSHPDLRKSPGFLKDDMTAQTFAYNLPSLDEDEYVKGMAEADARMEENKYLDEVLHGEDGSKILGKVKDEDYALFQVSLRMEALRFDMVRDYSVTRSLIQEAAKQVMPEGRLLELSFEDHGGYSAPMAIYLTTSEGQPKLQMKPLYGNPGFSMTIDDEVLAKVRELIETEKVYQSQSHYFRPADLPNTPRMLDGPGNWDFMAKFEGGEIKSSGSRVMTPNGISKVTSYLYGMLYDEQRKANEEQE